MINVLISPPPYAYTHRHLFLSSPVTIARTDVYETWTYFQMGLLGLQYFSLCPSLSVLEWWKDIFIVYIGHNRLMYQRN